MPTHLGAQVAGAVKTDLDGAIFLAERQRHRGVIGPACTAGGELAIDFELDGGLVSGGNPLAADKRDQRGNIVVDELVRRRAFASARQRGALPVDRHACCLGVSRSNPGT